MAEQICCEKAIRQNLIDAGCEKELMARFFSLQEKGAAKEQIKLLAVHRKTLLDHYHDAQRALDCLDFLIYKMRGRDMETR